MPLFNYSKSRHLDTRPFKPPEVLQLPAFEMKEWHEYWGNVHVPLPEILTQGIMKQRTYNQRVRTLINPNRKLCGQANFSMPDTTCAQPAGHGTAHPGTGRCSKHEHQGYARRGGGSQNKLIIDYVERLRMASTYGDPVDIDPHTALLMEVQRTAGHVEWLREMINTVAAGEPDNMGKALTAWTPLGITPSIWIQMYQEERKHLVRVCQAAISAGVAERTVRLAQDQARMIAMIFKSFILDNRLEMTPRQRLKAPEIIRELLAGMPANGTVIDADSTEEEQAPATPSPPPTKRSRSKNKVAE